MATVFQYTKAICRSIPKSLTAGALRMNDSDVQPIDFDKACSLQEKYIETLRSVGVDVIVLDQDEAFPDCVFVEDPAVIVKDQALITNPGHPSRRGETVLMEQTLKGLKLRVSIMKDPAKLDGGDVLFTGKELFVGLTSRTNQEGLEFLQETFAEYPVHGIKVSSETLHLKSMMSMAGDNIIAIGQSNSACLAMKEIQSKAKYPYEIIKVGGKDCFANCLWVNGHLIHRSSQEFSEIGSYYSALQCPKIELSNSELTKADGCLTCCSLLIN